MNIISTEHLRLISESEVLTLDPTDGTEVIAEASRLFSGCLDPNFKYWKTDVKGSPTTVQGIQVFEMTKDGAFEEIYGGLRMDLNTLCLTQGQIIGSVQKYQDWFCKDGYSTFFLFKVGDEFFVICAHNYSNGFPKANLYRLSYNYVWWAKYRARFVIPQQVIQAS